MELSFVREAVFIAVAFAASATFLILMRRFRWLEPVPAATDAGPTIAVEDLGEVGPRREGPQLELYNVPMRLVGIVLAPTGRDKEPVADTELRSLIDQITPGLGNIYEADRPTLWQCPPQLSVQGFTRVFFARAPLPGDGGKGTKWSAVAGRFEAGGQKYVAGLRLVAASANNLGQIAVERETQWLDLLRVRNG